MGVWLTAVRGLLALGFYSGTFAQALKPRASRAPPYAAKTNQYFTMSLNVEISF